MRRGPSNSARNIIKLIVQSVLATASQVSTLGNQIRKAARSDNHI
jgi:hypothetical protein